MTLPVELKQTHSVRSLSSELGKAERNRKLKKYPPILELIELWFIAFFFPVFVLVAGGSLLLSLFIGIITLSFIGGMGSWIWWIERRGDCLKW